MHELSIVYGIIAAVEDAAEKSGAKHVTTVTVRVGALAGVMPEALLFGYEAVTPGTLLEGSKLVIRLQPVVIRCAYCQSDRELPGVQSFRCPTCNRLSANIVSGRELEIESIEIEESEVAHADDANR